MPYYPNGVSYDDLGWYYTAPDTTIILNENATHYELISSKKIGELAAIKSKTNENELTIINEVVTVTNDQAKNHCSLHIDIMPENTLRLYGCSVQTEQPKKLDLAIPDPVLFAKKIILNSLAEHQITLKGEIVTGRRPKDTVLIAQLQSAPLSELINHMLKESDNLYADNLAKHLAYALTKEASNKQARYALREILAKNTKLDMSQLEIADAVGTRYNLATAEQIVLLLTTIHENKKLFSTFFLSLPQAAVSGTLKDRMKKTNLEKKVYAKTGTMHDITSLSGYLIDPHGRPIVFSIIINGVNKSISKAKGLEEQILSIIEQEINGEFPPSPEFA
jgi:D-alanyl-D-alanine carboxypeptidase/D-alanyl-D-alanine-endopeptidase (penicillin-binding protein 4)